MNAIKHIQLKMLLMFFEKMKKTYSESIFFKWFKISFERVPQSKKKKKTFLKLKHIEMSQWFRLNKFFKLALDLRVPSN